MYIKNRKVFLICMLVSIVGTILAFVGLKVSWQGFIGGICNLIIVLGILGSLLCGALGIIGSLFKGIVNFFLFKIVGVLFAVLLIGPICAVWLFVPGVFAVIGYFKHKDELH